MRAPVKHLTLLVAALLWITLLTVLVLTNRLGALAGAAGISLGYLFSYLVVRDFLRTLGGR